MQQVKKIVIVARGSEEGAVDMAVEEAMRRIEAGNLSGGDRNESGAFYFDVTENVPAAELPAGGDEGAEESSEVVEADAPQSFEQIVEKAQQAFWQAIAESYPTITSGDLWPDASHAFDEHCKAAARSWVEENLPAGSIVRTEDGYRLTRTEEGDYTDGDLTYGSLKEMEVDFYVLDRS
jgi:hypothetical protein